ncbi:MAG: HEAT repeat domain-containing protein [Gemmataceae bacterium]|nr:HEAT repeat domain-containing protein [Gemmataceae bacterium]MDW8266748.1 HEAT repeat domain-containing protein [Gemmataceae bacterium]
MRRLIATCLGVSLLLWADSSGQSPRKEDAPKLMDTLQNGKSIEARIQAAKDLGHLGQLFAAAARPAVPLLLKIVTDTKGDTALREASAEALGKIGGDNQIVPTLIKIVNDEKENKSVRLGAIRGLSYMGSDAKSAAADLRKLSKEYKEKDKRFAKAAMDAAKNILGEKK